MASQQSKKNAILDWEAYRQNIRKATPVDLSESQEGKRLRIQRLEANPQEWKKYYFKKFFTSESPEFHKKASERLLKNFLKNNHWYEVRHWVRGLSKTTTAMMDFLYLVLTGKLKNIIYCSSTYDAAVLFLTKWQAQLDSNGRIINDYGKQQLEGSWSSGSFRTRQGVQFTAIGAGQSPRGNGNEEIRPDGIICDDFDTDEECLNVDRINKKWAWFEQALFFTVDIARPYLILWLGNIIAPDCCVVRAGKIADHCEIINIRDGNGKSVWPEKNEEENINYALSRVSYESGQQEFFNNPMRQGQTFKEIAYGDCPALSKLKYAVVYADPSPANTDKPSAKSKVQNSCKAVGVLGFADDKYYVYKVWLDHTTNATFIDWLFMARIYVGDACPVYVMVENNSLQNPFYEQVLMPLVWQKEKEWRTSLGIKPDDQKKPDKWVRIEATLEPLVRLGRLVFNVKEKESDHMKRMAAQFTAASATSRMLDGPDMVQGGVKIIQDKNAVITAGGITIFKRRPNKKGY